MIDPDGPVRSAWDFLLAVFTIALLIYIPVLIAFYSSALQCVFVGGHTPKSAEEQHAPPQPISAVQFMTLTNMAFLVSCSVGVVFVLQTLPAQWAWRSQIVAGVCWRCVILAAYGVRYAEQAGTRR